MIDGARVVCHTPVDSRHSKTGSTAHALGSEDATPAEGLAICQYEWEDAFRLFGCDEEWKSQTDTCVRL